MGVNKLIAWLLPGLLLMAVHGGVLAADSFKVVVSIKPIHSIVAGLMEGIDPPALLVDGKSTPYDYELSAGQKTSLQQADLIIWVGPELESFLQEPLSELRQGTHVLELLSNSKLKVLSARTNDEQRDPFIWLDSRNAVILLNELTYALIEADPSRSHVYTRNRGKVLRKLAKVDRELEYGYRGLKGMSVFLYYDTLQYFEQAYALKVGMTLQTSPSEAVDAARLLQTRDALAKGGYGCLLTEAGLPAKNLPLLTDGTAIRVGVMDSFGTRLTPGPELYTQLMRYNTKVIKECLNLTSSTKAGKTVNVVEAKEPDVLAGRFILINQYGEEVRAENMLGKYQLLYFGYTSCPDICPLSLTTMNVALKKLGDKAELIQPYFITVDPERDTVAVIRDYVAFFNRELIGLTGSREMISRVAQQYNVRYEKVIDDPDRPDDYQMDHTASVFMIAPDGRFLAKFANGIKPSQLAAKIDELLP